MDTCIICYKKCNSVFKKNKCLCKFNIHLECYQEMRHKCNISCPICREKIVKNEHLYSERYTISYRNIESLNKSIIFMTSNNYIGTFLSLMVITLFLPLVFLSTASVVI